ncbi:hypothetical protein [Lacticaseibacillus songhuajiangensis]|uniref:hypothetical protein n=1 Tax=Lacticaseibacillus songhuajiangensis TaxID=1296539 RepID=UPI000F7A3DF2|nr:hypothetical protein [Lacticaseibacillus songhuajiangensis]
MMTIFRLNKKAHQGVESFVSIPKRGSIRDFDKISTPKSYRTPDGYSIILDGRDALMTSLAAADMMDNLAAIINLPDSELREAIERLNRKYSWAFDHTDKLEIGAGYPEVEWDD